MTTQEAYEAIHAYFSAPDARLAKLDPTKGAYDLDRQAPNCVYRTPDGRGCAVGCLIPDDLYHPAFEGQGLNKLVDDHEGINSLFFAVDHAFLLEAQTHHDSATNPTDFLSRLDLTAENHGLIPVS